MASASEGKEVGWQPLFFLKRKQRKTEIARKEAAQRGCG